MFWLLFRVNILILFLVYYLLSVDLRNLRFLWTSLKPAVRRRFLETRFILTVLFIVFHVLILSQYYMGHELYYFYFIFATIIFVSSMVIFVIRDSIFTLFLGWDALGVSSFFLVIWFQRWGRLDRGIVTFLSNRLGDLFLVWRIISFSITGWIFRNRAVNIILSAVLICACFTKSAQVPFRVWLPLAISAPTPIRALVHSRTLVAAGFLLVLKFNILLASRVLASGGILTLCLAGGVRCFEIDLKKVVALSTLSQLGLIGIALGFNLYSLAFFHIIRHAFVKRALLIVVGVLLHKRLSSQEKQFVYLSGRQETYVLISLVVCSFALCGLAFTRGIVTKENILNSLLFSKFSFLIVFIFRVGVLFTFIYCLRIVLRVLQLGVAPWRQRNRRGGSRVRRILLIFLAVFGGSILSESFVFIVPSLSSLEKWIPFVLLLAALRRIQFLRRGDKLIASIFGLSSLFKQRRKIYLDLSKVDLKWIDRLNFSFFWWVDYIFSRFLKIKRKWIYIFIYITCVIFFIF